MPRTLRVAAFLMLVAACGGESRKEPLDDPLLGTGASFPAPLFERWAMEYARETGQRIDYRALGSSKGIDDIMAGGVDFAGSEVPLTADQLAQSPDVLHIPITLAPVAVVYNVDGIPPDLRLTPDVLTAIFMGEVDRWDDTRLGWLNPGVDLPPTPIRTVHRLDGSGTTKLFTAYLATVSPEWEERVGSGARVEWPVGFASNGNEGVSELVWKSPGTIAYVGLTFARAKRLNTALLGNSEGRFVAPTLDGARAAAVGGTGDGEDVDLRASIVNAPGPWSYPISGYSYVLLHGDHDDCERADALGRFVRWVLRRGQDFAPSLSFAPLPIEVADRAERQLSRLNCAGDPVLGR
jgi:phosphate transport system substrate-binding protein